VRRITETKTIQVVEAMPPEETQAYFACEEKIVFGHDFQRDRNGAPIEVGIGSPGRESVNHMASILKYEGQEAYQAACDAIWKRDPEHAKRLGLKRRGAA
jgi:hypothetical protein